MTNSPVLAMSSLPGPNEEMLEAQARVCTGPTQTRPLGVSPRDPDPDRILSLLLASARDELPRKEAVSRAQMGAFLVAMSIRRRFPRATGWSDAEAAAFARHTTALRTALPASARFLLNIQLDPDPQSDSDALLCDALREVISGRHLGYEATLHAARAALDPCADPVLRAALLIGQRMNRETFEEFRGYADAAFEAEQALTVRVPNLLHIGEPYNGSTRFFKPTLFVAVVRAEMRRATVLHGVPSLPPKYGITEEQILGALGAGTRMSLDEAASLLEDPDVGFAYVSQREYAPRAFAAAGLRLHIKKRPPFAATEKAQLLFRTAADNFALVGTYHPVYEDPQLRLMQERGMASAAVIKGEEGSSQCSLRLGKASGTSESQGRKAVNHVQYCHRTETGFTQGSEDIDPRKLGLDYAASPRLESVTAESFARAGRDALAGCDGPIYDRIALNVAVIDTILGLEPNLCTAFGHAREILDGGACVSRLDAYIAASAARSVRRPDA